MAYGLTLMDVQEDPEGGLFFMGIKEGYLNLCFEYFVTKDSIQLFFLGAILLQHICL
jgi:hypothetical protein